MKKLMASIGLGLTALASQAQQFQAQPLMGPNVASLSVSNLVQITNKFTPTFVGTNLVGTTWTNKQNVRVVAAAGDTTSLLSDVRLWTNKEGNGWGTRFSGTNASTSTTLFPILSTQDTPMNFSVRMSSASGANAAVQFFFTAVPDGTYEETVGSTAWTCAFVPTASSTQVFVTNCPAWLWQGCSKLRLKFIVNTDTDATSQVVISAMSINGFVP